MIEEKQKEKTHLEQPRWLFKTPTRQLQVQEAQR
jgi:hypothetical protein